MNHQPEVFMAVAPVISYPHQLAALRSEIRSTMCKPQPAVSYPPYVHVALIVSAAAMAIFGNPPVVLIGALLFCTLFLASKNHLKPEEHTNNIRCRDLLNMLSAPGFFQFCQSDPRSLSCFDLSTRAFEQFQAGEELRL
jgi:hypothetical protein